MVKIVFHKAVIGKCRKLAACCRSRPSAFLLDILNLNRQQMARTRSSCCHIACRKAATRERPHLAGFCLLRIPIFYHSYVRFLQNGHYLVLTKEQEGGAFLVTTGHDFVGTINGKK
jgi:hypothetical protein